MAKTSEEYWREREAANAAATKLTEDEYVREINRRYQYMYTELEKQIYGFYAKYARDTGLTLAEAQKAVAKMDVKAFSTKAAKYVKEKDFSKKANAELKLYNATMKINRLELLKASMGLEMVDTFNDVEGIMTKGLTDAAKAELERQAGILKDTLGDNAKAARSIVGASFNNAHFSDRIWMYQRQLKNELDSLLFNGIIQGKSPDELARHLQKRFGVSRSNAERLMRTELCRVQTDAQMMSYENAGYDEYVYITVGIGACEICAPLDGQHFKVKDMQPGVNAPPMHPNCRCSTAAWMDRAAVEREVFGAELNPGGEAIRNTGVDVHYDNTASYSFVIKGLANSINESLSFAMRDVAQKGGVDGNEHLRLVDLSTGDWSYYETNGMPNEVGYEFWKYLNEHKDSRFAFVHNHNTDSSFSETDMRTLLTTEQIPIMIAVRNDGVIYLAERKGKILDSGWFDELYPNDIKRLNQQVADGTISLAERSKRRELIIVDNLLRDYTKAGEIVEYDTRK